MSTVDCQLLLKIRPDQTTNDRSIPATTTTTTTSIKNKLEQCLNGGM